MMTVAEEKENALALLKIANDPNNPLAEDTLSIVQTLVASAGPQETRGILLELILELRNRVTNPTYERN